MKQFTNNLGNILVLKRGEELHTTLIDYAKQHNLKSAWVQGLGGAGTVTLGYYNLSTREYQWKEFTEPFEILNVTGNMSIVDDEPFWHIHGSFGTPDYNVIGGHIQELVVGLTCELLVTPLEEPMTRVFDEETGLKLLD